MKKIKKIFWYSLYSYTHKKICVIISVPRIPATAFKMSRELIIRGIPNRNWKLLSYYCMFFMFDYERICLCIFMYEVHYAPNVIGILNLSFKKNQIYAIINRDVLNMNTAIKNKLK